MIVCLFFTGKKKKGKAVSKYDPDIMAEVERQFAEEIGSGAPDSWFPDEWLAFMLGGKPAREKCFLTVDAPLTVTEVDSLSQMCSTKLNRRNAKEFVTRKQKATSSSSSAEDMIDLTSPIPATYSPVRESSIGIPVRKHLAVDISTRKHTSTEEAESFKLKELINSYDNHLAILTRQLKRQPDNESLEEQMLDIEAKKTKVLVLQQKKLEESLGI